MELTLGEEKQITTWREALTHVSEMAHAKMPEALHGNVERATALCLHRHVWFDEDGKHAQVLSSDGSTYYLVNGNCTCMDAPRAQGGYCKHKLATMIYRRASELLHAAPGTPAVPPPAALPEAPASVNVRLCIGGAEVQWTVRDQDEDRLAERLERLLQRFPQAAKSQPAAPAGASQPTPEGWCLIHNLQMARQQNERGHWFSHRAPDGGWCRGKAPRA
jgi:hypothetical protein